MIKIILWFIFIVLTISLSAKYNDIEILSSLLLSGVIMQLTIISFLRNWCFLKRPKLLDWFRLVTFFVLVYSFYNTIDNIGRDTLSFPDYIIHKNVFFPSLLIVFIGLIGLKISELLIYFFTFNRNKLNSKIVYKIKNDFVFFSLAFLIGFIQLFLIFKGIVGYGTLQEHTTSAYSFLLQFSTAFSIIILSLFSIFKFMYGRNDTFFNFNFLFFFGVQIVFGLLSGMKESTILPLVIVLIPYMISGRKISKKWMIISILAIIIIYPINDNYRKILNSSPSINKSDAYKAAFALTINNNFSEMVNEGSESYSSRLNLFPFLMYSYENEQEWTYYKNMDRYIYLPVSFLLPRFLIPDKPKSDTGGIFNELVFGYGTNSITPTTYGWSYYEGGFGYVFITFFLFGMFISIIETIINLKIIFDLLIFIIILIILIKVESDIYFIISDIMQKILIIHFSLKILIKRKYVK